MRNLLARIILPCLLVAAPAHAADTPKNGDIEKAMRTTWDKPATAMSGATTIQINSIKIGSGAKANEQDLVDGIPEGRWVTVVLVDFTVREKGGRSTHAVRRTRVCKVYKDQFDEWAVMIWQARGTDQSFDEPPAN
jgi:hypothetical protein